MSTFIYAGLRDIETSQQLQVKQFCFIECGQFYIIQYEHMHANLMHAISKSKFHMF